MPGRVIIVEPAAQAQSEPLLIVFSGPSGVGKDSVLRILRGRMLHNCYPVTVTTRAPRAGEVDGVSYIFVTRPRFEEMRAHGKLFAAADVHGHLYGVPFKTVCGALMRGQDVVLKVDVQGAEDIRRRFPNAVYVFLAPPSEKDLIERLRARHTELGADLERRIEDASREMAEMDAYDYAIVNRDGEIDRAADDLVAIITAERLRLHREPVALGQC